MRAHLLLLLAALPLAWGCSAQPAPEPAGGLQGEGSALPPQPLVAAEVTLPRATAAASAVVTFAAKPDRDHDGIPDEEDLCPTAPEDKRGELDHDGCPARADGGDIDGDGLRDSVDKCPDQPEDRDGFEDSDGCPDLDNDRDGITDTGDRCPNEPETKNGFQDEDGCPDKRK